MTVARKFFLVALLLVTPEAAALEKSVVSAACAISVTTELTVNDGTVPQQYSSTYYGCGVIISPDGYLLTCRHLACPVDLIDQTFYDTDNLAGTTALTDVSLTYYVSCANGMIFEATVRPSVLLVRKEAIGRPFVTCHENTSWAHSISDSQTLHLIGSDETDVTVLKLISQSPLPYLSLINQTIDDFDQKGATSTSVKALTVDIIDNVTMVTIREGYTEGSLVTNRYGNPTITLNMKSYQGDSGSGVVTNGGKLAGLLWGNHSPTKNFDETFIIPSSYLRCVLAPDANRLKVRTVPKMIENLLSKLERSH